MSNKVVEFASKKTPDPKVMNIGRLTGMLQALHDQGMATIMTDAMDDGKIRLTIIMEPEILFEYVDAVESMMKGETK